MASGQGKTVLEQALAFVRAGIPVFPACWPVQGECGCGRGHAPRDAGKAPLTPHGFKDATTDEAQVVRWWAASPLANLAVATGGEAGLIVLDVDGLEGQQSIAGRHLPTTPNVRTPGNGGGTHYYFRLPGCPFSSAVRLLPGVDVRANGGYVIAPPSLHRAGEPYRWNISPDEAAFASPPSWLVDLLRAQRDRPPAHVVCDTDLLRSVAAATRALQDLASFRRDEYGPWLEVGMALSELGEIGLFLWDAWSKGSAKYEPGVCAHKWRTFTPGAGLGIGSLIHWAREDRDSRGAAKSIIDIERGVLGYAIVTPSALPHLVDEVSPDMFVGPLHRQTWSAIVHLYKAGGGATVEGIAAIIGDTEAAESRLAELPSESCPEDTIRSYIAILNEHRAARRVRDLGYELARIAESRRDVIERAQAAWNAFISGLPMTGNEMGLDELVNAAHAFAAREPGYPSAIPGLDNEIGLLDPGSLVFLYGTPGQGKTLLALAAARRQSKQGYRVGFLSLEMSPGPLGLRVVMAETGCQRKQLDGLARNPEMDTNRVWEKARELARNKPIRFAFNVRDIDDIVRLGRRWKDVYAVQILYVDHLQEITTRRAAETSVAAMDYIVGCLKDLALRTGMVVIALAQFNRNYLFQLAEGKDLGFESLRGSSRIEQSADRILFILPENRTSPARNQLVENIEIHVKKNRNGRKGKVTVAFDYSRQDIVERKEDAPWKAWGEL